MLEPQQTYAIAKFPFDHLDSRIRRRIIDEDNFDCALREHTTNRVAHQLGTVPRRNHNAEERSFHFSKRT